MSLASIYKLNVKKKEEKKEEEEEEANYTDVFQTGYHKIKDIDPDNIQRSTGVYGEKLTRKDVYSPDWFQEETRRILLVASDPIYQFLNILCGVIQSEFSDVIDSDKALSVSSNILKQMNKFYDDGRTAAVANEMKRSRPELEALDRKHKRKKGNLNEFMDNYESSLKSNAFDYGPFFGKHMFDVKDIDAVITPDQLLTKIFDQVAPGRTIIRFRGEEYNDSVDRKKQLFEKLRNVVSKYLPGETVTNDIERKFLEVMCSINYDVVRRLNDTVRDWWLNESKMDFVHDRNNIEERKKKSEDMLKKIMELGGKGPPSLGIALGVSEPLPMTSVFAALRWLAEEKQTITSQDLQLIMTMFSSEPPNNPEWTTMLHHLGNVFITSVVMTCFNNMLIAVRRQSNLMNIDAGVFVGFSKGTEEDKRRHSEVRVKFAELVGMEMLLNRNTILIRMNNQWTFNVIVEKRQLLLELFSHLKLKDSNNTLYFSDDANDILSGVKRYSTQGVMRMPDNNITRTFREIMYNSYL